MCGGRMYGDTWQQLNKYYSAIYQLMWYNNSSFFLIIPFITFEVWFDHGMWCYISIELIYWVRCGVKYYGYSGVWVKLWMSLKFYNIHVFQRKRIIHMNQNSCFWFPFWWHVTVLWFAWGVTTLSNFRSIWVWFMLTLALMLLSRSSVMVASAALITLMLVRRESAGIIITLLLCAFLFISLFSP